MSSPLSLLLTVRCRVIVKSHAEIALFKFLSLIVRCQGVGLSRSTRGRQIVPDVPDAEVLQVPVAALSGEHKLCVTHNRKVSVNTDNTCAQLSTNGITSLTDRKHKCVYCASMGRCNKHCFTKRRRLSNVATKKSSRGSREAADA